MISDDPLQKSNLHINIFYHSQSSFGQVLFSSQFSKQRWVRSFFKKLFSLVPASQSFLLFCLCWQFIFMFFSLSVIFSLAITFSFSVFSSLFHLISTPLCRFRYISHFVSISLSIVFHSVLVPGLSV